MDHRHFAELAHALQATPGPEDTAEEVVAFAHQQLDADYAGISVLAAELTRAQDRRLGAANLYWSQTRQFTPTMSPM